MHRFCGNSKAALKAIATSGAAKKKEVHDFLEGMLPGQFPPAHKVYEDLFYLRIWFHIAIQSIFCAEEHAKIACQAMPFTWTLVLKKCKPQKTPITAALVKEIPTSLSPKEAFHVLDHMSQVAMTVKDNQAVKCFNWLRVGTYVLDKVSHFLEVTSKQKPDNLPDCFYAGNKKTNEVLPMLYKVLMSFDKRNEQNPKDADDLK
jgi:hypothetical protein